jgi:hypothetical protein
MLISMFFVSTAWVKSFNLKDYIFVLALAVTYFMQRKNSHEEDIFKIPFF